MSLLFLYDDIITKYNDMKIPMKFVCFAYVEGKFYKHMGRNVPFLIQNPSRAYQGGIVYGAIFEVEYFGFYDRIIDSYYSCSMSALRKNHQLDLMHRVSVKATPIVFDTFDEFCTLAYREVDGFAVQTYVGNQTHPNIKRRIGIKKKYGLVDKTSLMKLWEGVSR